MPFTSKTRRSAVRRSSSAWAIETTLELGELGLERRGRGLALGERRAGLVHHRRGRALREVRAEQRARVLEQLLRLGELLLQTRTVACGVVRHVDPHLDGPHERWR